MSLLSGTTYDPSTAVEVSTGSLKAMTALDTTNLRAKFVAPSNGKVLVRLKGQVGAQATATTFPSILLGVLEGTTLKGRVSPIGSVPSPVKYAMVGQEAIYVQSGLTPGNEYTWDAAYGVDVILASTAIKYGGEDAKVESEERPATWGGFAFEVWECANLLAGTLYDPTSSTSKSCSSIIGMTALDTTNLRLSFVAPSSGKVLWRINGQLHGATTLPTILLGIKEGATIKARTAPVLGLPTTLVATGRTSTEASGVITGLTPGTEYTWDASYAVTKTNATTAFKYGGPNDTTTNNCFGGIAYEIWAA